MDEDVAGLVTAALAGGSARARLLEAATASRTSRNADLDLILDDLATRAGVGDEASLELLLDLVHRLGLARSAIVPVVSDAASVDDVAQTTLMAVERNISSFAGRAKFRTWLFSIARNEALMSVRPRRAEPVAEPPETSARFSTVVAFRITMEALVDGLDEPYRETMRLQVFENLGYEEIATRLGVPIGTVRSRLAKARDLLWVAMKAEKAGERA
ncbi:MAG TPA: sigma-70 family RNA polymerase sigma factor [Acidimicrobiales bacterium]|nr:sigma-70 family RNA polymerase sigma factor [Acidimicrobiales bacterium]